MTDTKQDQDAAEPFARAWGDFMSQFGMAGAAGSSNEAPTPSWSDEAMKQMQRTFLDALAKYCDEFMRSPQFLNMMKQSMDNALSFKQHVDRFLTEAHRSVHSPSIGDVDDIVGLLRTIEDRVIQRIDVLETRLRDVEGPARGKSAKRKTGSSAGSKVTRKKPDSKKPGSKKPAAAKTRSKDRKRR